MSTLLLVTLVCAPALTAPLLFVQEGRFREIVDCLAPWGAFPVLILSMSWIRFPTVEVPWFLVGARFELDAIGRAFLVVAALLWTSSGVYAAGYVKGRHRRRFFFFFLLTMTGNLGLPLAADAVTFYFFFALMTFAAYGLVVHSGNPEARRASRVYLILAVVGEAFLLMAMLLAVDATGGADLAMIPRGITESSYSGLIILCLLIGFGIKAGAVPLHVWLPLAHPVAPTPASAVLSGCMIEAGLLGWIRFLPMGETSEPQWGALVVTLGVVAAFFGVVLGLLQQDPKTILAYSSVSQMGVMNTMIGLAMVAPGAEAPAVAAVTLYAAHHGLAKGSLFLSVGIVEAGARSRFGRAMVAMGVLLPALALVGLPLTSGSIAKGQLKMLSPLVPPAWQPWIEPFLLLSIGATSLLMVHLLVRIFEYSDASEPGVVKTLWMPWVATLLGVTMFVPIVAGGYEVHGVDEVARDLIPAVGALLAFTVAVSGWRRFWRGRRPPHVPPGDILGPFESGLARMPRPAMLLEKAADRGIITGIAVRWYRLYSESGENDRLLHMELAITRWRVGVALLLFLTGTIALLLIWGR